MDVFIFDPRYAGYPDSGKPHYHTLRPESLRTKRTDDAVDVGCFLIFGVLLLCLPICSLLWLFADFGYWLAFVILLVLIISVLRHVGRVVWRARAAVNMEKQQYHRLITPDGVQTLPGEILSSRVERFMVFMSGATIRTSVTYCFTTPSGKTLTAVQTRPEIIAVPPAGTPVRVLYADDDAYVML